jgi:hypothetical protein
MRSPPIHRVLDAALPIAFLLPFAVYVVAPGLGIYDTIKELTYLSWIRTEGLHSLTAYWWAPPTGIAWYPAIAHSHDFLAIPETVLFSPMILLLTVVAPGVFYKLFVAVHAAVGLAACWHLARRLTIIGLVQSDVFPILAGLFIAGPAVIQHEAIGYLPWATFFLLPALLSAVTLERWSHALLAGGLVVGITVLEGGSHELTMMLAVSLPWSIALSVKRGLRPVLSIAGILLTGGLIAAPRLLTTAARYGNFTQSLQAGFRPGELATAPFAFPITYGKAAYTVLGQITTVPSWDARVFFAPVLLGAALAAVWTLTRRGRISARIWWIAAVLATAAALELVIAIDGVAYRSIQFLDAVSRSLADSAVSAEKYPYRIAVPGFELIGLAAILVIGNLRRGSWRMTTPWTLAAFVALLVASLVLEAAAYGRGSQTFGHAGSASSFVFWGVALVSVALLVASRRVAMVETILIAAMWLASASWFGLAVSTPLTEPAPSVVGASSPVSDRTLRFTSITVPSGDVAALTVDGDTWRTIGSDQSVAIQCEQVDACRASLATLPLAPGIVISLATLAALVALFVLGRRTPAWTVLQTRRSPT